MKNIARCLILLFISLVIALVLISLEISLSIYLSTPIGNPYSFIGLRFVLIFAAGIAAGCTLLWLARGEVIWLVFTGLTAATYYAFGITRMYEGEWSLSDIVPRLLTEPLTAIFGPLVLGLVVSDQLFKFLKKDTNNKCDS